MLVVLRCPLTALSSRSYFCSHSSSCLSSWLIRSLLVVNPEPLVVIPEHPRGYSRGITMPPKSASQALLMFVQSRMQYLKTRVEVTHDFGSERHNLEANRVRFAMMHRIDLCPTLQPTDATLILEHFETDLLSEKAKDMLADAIISNTNLNFAHIDDHECDGNQKVRCILLVSN